MAGRASKLRASTIQNAPGACPRVFAAVLSSFLTSVLLLAGTAHSADKPASIPTLDRPTPAIVIGFVGGFVHSNDTRHSEVQLAQKLRAHYTDRAHIEMFENRQWQQARQAILKWLDADADGNLSDAEKRGARIILYGHSWGASAVIALARELQQENIPVLLTVQVDSIAKRGQDDGVVPANVAQAVNFYQTQGLLHGRTQIIAADPARTEILGDFRFDYKNQPAACHDYPWLNRHLFKGHTAIECDPRVWSQVEALINTHFSSANQQVPTETALQISK